MVMLAVEIKAGILWGRADGPKKRPYCTPIPELWLLVSADEQAIRQGRFAWYPPRVRFFRLSGSLSFRLWRCQPAAFAVGGSAGRSAAGREPASLCPVAGGQPGQRAGLRAECGAGARAGAFP